MLDRLTLPPCFVRLCNLVCAFDTDAAFAIIKIPLSYWLKYLFKKKPANSGLLVTGYEFQVCSIVAVGLF
jgi:hypothetical protein